MYYVEFGGKGETIEGLRSYDDAVNMAKSMSKGFYVAWIYRKGEENFISEWYDGEQYDPHENAYC